MICPLSNGTNIGLFTLLFKIREVEVPQIQAGCSFSPPAPTFYLKGKNATEFPRIKIREVEVPQVQAGCSFSPSAPTFI